MIASQKDLGSSLEKFKNKRSSQLLLYSDKSDTLNDKYLYYKMIDSKLIPREEKSFQTHF